MTKKLSSRQSRIFTTIQNFIETHGYPPTVRDITAACDISSTSVTDYNLDILCERGYIDRAEGISRGISLTGKGLSPAAERVRRVRRAGAICACEDFRLEETENAELIAVSASMLAGRKNVVAVDVSDDSFNYALFAAGDTMLIDLSDVLPGRGSRLLWFRPAGRLCISAVERAGTDLRIVNPGGQPVIVPKDHVEIKGRILGAMRAFPAVHSP